MKTSTTPVQPVVSSHFDAGAIEQLAPAERLSESWLLRLAICQDSHAEFRQWFHFRLSQVRDQALQLRFENAGQCTYVEGWRGYQVVASYDQQHWFRLPTQFDGQTLQVEVTAQRDVLWLAYFEPYSQQRHQALLGKISGATGVHVDRLGSTVEGRDLDLVRIDDGHKASAAPVWIIARQHPGESMAQWFVEGLIERLLDASDPVARRARQLAAFCLVPNMNPDGSVRGNLRCNAAGANLNREWLAPDAVRSPEVLLVRERMQQTGVSAFLDVHGDEGLPWVFVVGNEMLPGFTPAQAAEQAAFIADFKQASPDFQDVHGYPAGKYSEQALRLASKWVGHSFGCLSLTLEMPFKDNAGLADAECGWSGKRSRQLGAASLLPLLQCLERQARASSPAQSPAKQSGHGPSHAA